MSLEQARERLRELGYLDGRVEHFVFRRAFAGRGGLFLPAILTGALAAALAAMAAVLSADRSFHATTTAILVLFAHLFLANLPVAALLSWPAVLAADRSGSPAGAATVLGIACAGVIFVLWIAGTYGLARELSASALLWGAPISVVAMYLARSVRSGFLACAYAHSQRLPGRRRVRVFFAVAVVGMLAAVAIFASRPRPLPPGPLRISPRRETLVVVAVDGLALDSLAGSGSSSIGQMLSQGATGWWPAPTGVPPEIWTDLSTGCSSSRHGVRALERVRPIGSSASLRPPFGTTWYLRGVAPAFRLVSSTPVSADDRQCLAFWEVAASAGLPSVAVGWWASGPWPGAKVIDNRQILVRAVGGTDADRAALAEFQVASRAGGIAALYLPGPDILRGDRVLRSVDLSLIGEFLLRQIERASRGEIALVVLASDSHPAAGALGRMIVYDGVLPVFLRIRPEDVAASILARAGVPVALDLPGRPVAALFRKEALDRATVETYGPRAAVDATPPAATDREYLEKLKSLGYLN